MRLHDLEQNPRLFEVTLNQQQISNLFASVAAVIARDPISSNRTLLGRMVDKFKTPQGSIEQTWKHLENQIKFSTALPTVGPEFDKHVRMIMQHTGNDPAIKNKFDDFNKTMMTKPKSQKFMLDLAQSVSGLAQSGINNQQIMDLLGRVDKLLDATPLGMAQSVSPAAQSTTTSTAPAAVQEQFSLKLNKLTRDQLINKWVEAGRPTDSIRIATVLLKAGVGQDQLEQAYANVNLELPPPRDQSTAPTAATGSARSALAAGTRSTRQTTAAAPSTSRRSTIRDYDSATKAADQLFDQVSQLKAQDRTQFYDYVRSKVRGPR